MVAGTDLALARAAVFHGDGHQLVRLHQRQRSGYDRLRVAGQFGDRPTAWLPRAARTRMTGVSRGR